MEPWEMHAWYADYLDACNRHDLDAIRTFIDPSVRRAHLPGGVEAWMADTVEVLDAFPDWQVRRIQLIAEDDRIAAHVRAGGTHTGAFRGIRPTRRHVNVAEFSFLRLAGGRIVEFAGTTDHAALLAQLTD
ncbi:ester cyclase [Microbacterium sp. cf332]|uniref:ester cyclase n=1 Tax=Microbacterium sp. cf332 TaxID=1761804 RepID=UPI000B89C6D0|nr:ester cyclase [Microbacterium sp. cf332]